MSAPLLAIDRLHIAFPHDGTQVVRHLSLSIAAGEIAGLIGESGSGKSMTAMAVLGLLPPGAVASGRIRFEGEDILGCEPILGGLRGRALGFVPQEPMTALNPTLTIARQLLLPMLRLEAMTPENARARAITMLSRMSIADPERVMAAYPFELSGGLRQRVLLASAFMMGPRLILADEPTTALDVTTQAEILAILKDCASKAGAAVLLITHNVGVVWGLCDSVHVMRRGEIVEHGPARAVLSAPRHAYTRTLCEALPERAGHRQPIGVRP